MVNEADSPLMRVTDLPVPDETKFPVLEQPEHRRLARRHAPSLPAHPLVFRRASRCCPFLRRCPPSVAPSGSSWSIKNPVPLLHRKSLLCHWLNHVPDDLASRGPHVSMFCQKFDGCCHACAKIMVKIEFQFAFYKWGRVLQADLHESVCMQFVS